MFDSTQDACLTVSDIIAAGIIPASMEMMDGAMIRVTEEAFRIGLPTSAQALLLLEVDGVESGLDADLAGIEAIARKIMRAIFKAVPIRNAAPNYGLPAKMRLARGGAAFAQLLHAGCLRTTLAIAGGHQSYRRHLRQI